MNPDTKFRLPLSDWLIPALWLVSGLLWVWSVMLHPSVQCYVINMNTCWLTWWRQSLPGVSATFIFLYNSKEVRWWWWWWWRRMRRSGPALCGLTEVWWWWRGEQRWPPGVHSLSSVKTESSAAVWRLLPEDRWAAHLRTTRHRLESRSLNQTWVRLGGRLGNHIYVKGCVRKNV